LAKTPYLSLKGGITMKIKSKELKKNKTIGISRRRFIKTTLTGAAIAGTGGVLPSLEPAA
jgi:hypothetical protein